MLMKEICLKCDHYCAESHLTPKQWSCGQAIDKTLTTYFKILSEGAMPPEWCPFDLEHKIAESVTE